MYRIKIKSKGLTKAQYQNSQIGKDGYPFVSFGSYPNDRDIAPPFDVAKQMEKEKKEFELRNKKQQSAFPSFMGPQLDSVDKQYRSDPIFEARYDTSLLGAQRNRGEQRKYNKFFEKKYNPFYEENKFANTMNNIDYGIAGASAVVDFLGKQKELNKWLRTESLPDNMYSVAPGDDRGDFDINEGIYQANRLIPPNVGANYEARYGGTQPSGLRIKIKSSPDFMQYGGQQRTGMSLGLDLGQRNVYRDMPKEKSEHTRDVIPEVPRSQANIEAERGETVYGDLDGDGSLEHMKIGGKRHTEGGTPLNVPEGSFIFSDTKKMTIKDPVILEKFGMKPRKEGYTPAEIAKKYDINKYKAIMEDPDIDPVRKSTAQLMIKNFMKKLGELALIQEGMKGFPQGVPQVARQTLPEAEQLAQSMEQEQTMEQGPSVEQQEGMAPPMGEQPYPEDEQMMEQEQMPFMEEQPQQMSPQQMPSQEMMMEEEQPEMEHGGYMPMYQGTQGGSSIYPWMFNAPQNTTQQQPVYTPGMNTAPPNMTMQDLQKKYPWFSPYTKSNTRSGRISRTTGKSTLFDPNTFSQYNDVDYWVNRAKSEGVNIGNIGDLQNYIYPILEKENPDVINEMWNTWGPTLQSNERNQKNFADYKAGARTAYALSRRTLPPPEEPGSVIGYLCVDGQVQQSSYMNEQARNQAGAKATEAEAAVNCGTSPSQPNAFRGKNVFQRNKWMTPDKVNLMAALASSPKKYLPYAAQVKYEPNRLSLEDWRAQAAAEQSMFNKQAELMGVYGPTTGQQANTSLAAGQAMERIGQQVIPGVTSRNVDRVNQYLAQERARKDQFNLLGAERATNLFDKNVVANQQYDNAKRQYLNNIAKTFGQGWHNAMRLGMLNAVNPRFKVEPVFGNTYYTGAGYGTNKLGSSGSRIPTMDDFAGIKASNLARGMSEARAEAEAIKAIERAAGQQSQSSNMESLLQLYGSMGQNPFT